MGILDAGLSKRGSSLGGKASYKSYQIGLSSVFIAPERNKPVTLNEIVKQFIFSQVIYLNTWCKLFQFSLIYFEPWFIFFILFKNTFSFEIRPGYEIT